MKSPCENCKPPKRTETCHITCQEYIEYSEERMRRNAEKKQLQDIAYLSQNNNFYYRTGERRKSYGRHNRYDSGQR